MSALSNIPFVAALTSAGASLTALAAIPSLRAKLVRILGIQAPGGIWRALFIILALLNYKNLPFAWHIRVFRGMIYQLYLQPTALQPTSLFEPIITSSRTTLYETDYNLHKSNSTYFSDFDVSRGNFMAALLRKAIRSAGMYRKVDGGTGKYNIALGGIACIFKKEVLPYEKFEIWTRLLAWDRKWIFLVSHMVKPGVARPKKYSLQPWRKGKALKSGEAVKSEEEEAAYRAKLKNSILATSIAKYVVKNGRVTIPVERVFERSGLLPPKPAETSANGHVNGEVKTVDESILPFDESEWTWESIEAERQRGLKFAEMFAGLDGLHDVYDGGENGAMGEFPDFIL